MYDVVFGPFSNTKWIVSAFAAPRRNVSQAEGCYEEKLKLISAVLNFTSPLRCLCCSRHQTLPSSAVLKPNAGQNSSEKN